MATGKTGSERTYGGAKNASNKDRWGSGGGRSYPGKRAGSSSDPDVRKQSTGTGEAPPGPAKPSKSCNSEYRQKGSSRSY